MLGEVISMLEATKRCMDDNIFNFTIDGKCSGCGSCCSNFLPMSDKEIRQIKKYIQKNKIEECKHLLPTSTPTYDMTCPFLDISKDKDKCRIYEVRPMICRKFLCDNDKRAKLSRNEINQTRNLVCVREEFFGAET